MTKKEFSCTSWNRWSPRSGRLREGWELRPTFANPALCKQMQNPSNFGPRGPVKVHRAIRLAHPKSQTIETHSFHRGGGDSLPSAEPNIQDPETTSYTNDMQISSSSMRRSSKGSNVNSCTDSREDFVRRYSKDLNNGQSVRNCGAMPEGNATLGQLKSVGSKDRPDSRSGRGSKERFLPTGSKDVAAGIMEASVSSQEHYCQNPDFFVRRGNPDNVNRRVSKEALIRNEANPFSKEALNPMYDNGPRGSSKELLSRSRLGSFDVPSAHNGSKDLVAPRNVSKDVIDIQNINNAESNTQMGDRTPTSGSTVASSTDKKGRRQSKSNEPTEEKVVDRSRGKGSKVTCIRKLSFDLNCPLETVKDARQLFKKYANGGGEDSQNVEGDLNRDAFERLMYEVLENSRTADQDQKKSMISKAWREADRNRNNVVDFEEFAIWYNSRAFDEEMGDLLTEKQIQSRELARKYNLSMGEVDSVFKKFHEFDLDGNGVIDIDEFEKLLIKLMKIPPDLELPAARVKQFWIECDLDRSGEVDFEEFLQWYMRYFDVSGETEISPIEHMYKSIRPEMWVGDGVEYVGKAAKDG
eukprot:gnl/MRDRNA2_/MRDRNA2_149263_c0_seq1.p1 gnl/MRDRNA2_/MRDRNA2_149263_c0~~gnl/MRDRNA2_/MRDRNA2_149263_c0_seq1.p1  ORF type:complete len:582 (-),score=120.16 gnl/MRDRNA2_/MRDRNA2_149263_c0_seq1:86-1831(-)